jgi:hypothetical protein
VVYPESWAIPLAVLAAVLVLVFAVRARSRVNWVRGMLLGAGALVLSIILAGGVAYLMGITLEGLHRALPWRGAPAWSGVYWAGMSLLGFSLVMATYTLVRRWAEPDPIHTGGLIVVAMVSLAVAVRAPGMSYLFTWPVIAAAACALATSFAPITLGLGARSPATWVAVFIVTSLLVPIAFAIGAIMLGVTGAGGVVAIVIVTLIAWLIAPVIDTLTETGQWVPTARTAAAALGFFAIGALTVRRGPDHPVPSRLVYVMDADGTDAWLVSSAPMARTNEWTRGIVGQLPPAPPFIARAVGTRSVVGKPVQRLAIESPSATVLSDSTVESRRQILLRLNAPRGTISLTAHVAGARVLASAIDGRVVDTTRFRRRLSEWAFQYWAPPDLGVMISLTLPSGSKPILELTARADGLPVIQGIAIPRRPEDVVAAQDGDVTLVYRRIPIG